MSRSSRIKNVLSLQAARERAREPKSGSDRQVSQRSNQRLPERLEAENARLQRIVVDLLLKIQALRDSARYLLPPPGRFRSWPDQATRNLRSGHSREKPGSRQGQSKCCLPALRAPRRPSNQPSLAIATTHPCLRPPYL